MEPDAPREVFSGALLRLEVESWGGRDYEIVRHPGAAAVLPLLPGGDALLVRQYRRAVRRALIEIPAGVLDVQGEDPGDAAARELFEETGHRHRSIEPLGTVFSSAGFSDEIVALFLAETEPEPEREPEDGIELLRMPFRELVHSAATGGIQDSKTALAILLADHRRQAS